MDLITCCPLQGQVPSHRAHCVAAPYPDNLEPIAHRPFAASRRVSHDHRYSRLRSNSPPSARMPDVLMHIRDIKRHYAVEHALAGA